MAIVPYNFENQTISAAGLAAVLRATLSDGPLHGCAIGYSGASVSIAPGRIVVGGYVFRLSATVSVAVPISDGEAAVVVRLDLRKPSTAEDFRQIDIRAEGGGYVPVRDDLDAGTGTICELVLARVTLSDGVITGVSYAAPSAHRAAHTGTTEPDASLGADGDVYIQYTE